jgi:hypothetical protein
MLRCDHEGCSAAFSANERRADVTRVHAAGVGWVHGLELPSPNRGGPARSLDYCAEHAADIGDLRPKALPAHARAI